MFAIANNWQFISEHIALIRAIVLNGVQHSIVHPSEKQRFFIADIRTTKTKTDRKKSALPKQTNKEINK